MQPWEDPKLERREQYHLYLQSDQWEAKRQEAFAKHGRLCAHCGGKKRIQVHHLTYARIFEEHVNDLMPLCVPHHNFIEVILHEHKKWRRGRAAALRQWTLDTLAGAPVVEKARRPRQKPHPNSKKAKKLAKRAERQRIKRIPKPPSKGTTERLKLLLKRQSRRFNADRQRSIDQLLLRCGGMPQVEPVIVPKMVEPVAPKVKIQIEREVFVDPQTILKKDIVGEFGWTKSLLADLGISWPPQKGWHKGLVGRTVSGVVYSRIRERLAYQCRRNNEKNGELLTPGPF